MAYKSDAYNMDEWYEFVKDKVFLIRNYRRVGDWTPEELDAKAPNQSQFEQGDDIFNYGRIEHFIELPDGNVMLGIRYIEPKDFKEVEFVTYKKLSEVSLVMPDRIEVNEVLEKDVKE